MKNLIVFIGLALVSCSQKNPVYAPVSGLNNDEMQVSKNRAKQLNTMERKQIEEWISKQNEKFYPTSLNYWSNIADLDKREKKQDSEAVTFQYELYDFAQQKFYDKPKTYRDAPLGKFEELEAIVDALKYLRAGEEATLLVPSLLAYGRRTCDRSGEIYCYRAND